MQALEGLRVIDMATVFAGPGVAKYLAGPDVLQQLATPPAKPVETPVPAEPQRAADEKLRKFLDSSDR